MAEDDLVNRGREREEVANRQPADGVKVELRGDVQDRGPIVAGGE
jgi:hypothetical protein